MLKIAVVVTNDKQGFAHGFELGYQCLIKHTAKGRVLVCGPFIEEEDVFLFGDSDEHGQSFSLAL